VTQSEKVEACMKQADYFAARFDGRREVEWKITLGFWVAILASIEILKGKLQDWWIPLVGAILIFGFSVFWLRGIWVAHENDKRQSFHFRSEAEKVLLDPNHSIQPTPGCVRGWRRWFGFLLDWSMLFQLVTTLILLFLAYKFSR